MAEALDLSIIVPAHNAALTIGATLESTVPLLEAGAECIVIDDGSTDDTARVVQSIAATHPGVVLVRQSNTGVSGARNQGVSRATRSWITFLDADDLIVPHGLVSAMTIAGALGLEIGKSRIHQVLESAGNAAETTAEDPLAFDSSTQWANVPIEFWLLEGWGGLLGCAFRKSLLDRMEPCFVSVPFGEDLVFTYDLSGMVHNFVSVEDVGYRYTMGSHRQMTGPANPLRLSITKAFQACEEIAKGRSTSRRALLWILLQKYRWSRAPHVAPAFRKAYKASITQYTRGVRRRLKLSRSVLLIETLRLARLERLRQRSAPRQSL